MTMPDLFRNKYRINSARLKNWDYSTPGAYFVTICAAGRECVFGRVERGKMILSEIEKSPIPAGGKFRVIFHPSGWTNLE